MRARIAPLLAAVLALSGCAEGAVAPVEAIDAEQLAQLPQDCEGLLDMSDSDPAVGYVNGADAYLVETSDGRCVSDGPTLLDSLRRHGYSDVALRVASDLALRGDKNGDPGPHPDLQLKMGPLSNHVDGRIQTDPSPHPDLDDQDEEDVQVLFVVVWVSD